MSDLSHIEIGDHSDEEWESLMNARDSGEEVRIHATVYNYFMDILPPRHMKGNLFVFGEGHDNPTLFKQYADGTFTMQAFPSYHHLYNHLGIKVRIIT